MYVRIAENIIVIAIARIKPNQQTLIKLIVAKDGGLQSQGAKADAEVNLLQSLGNEGSGALRLSRRANNMATIDPIL